MGQSYSALALLRDSIPTLRRFQIRECSCCLLLYTVHCHILLTFWLCCTKNREEEQQHRLGTTVGTTVFSSLYSFLKKLVCSAVGWWGNSSEECATLKWVLLKGPLFRARNHSMAPTTVQSETRILAMRGSVVEEVIVAPNKLAPAAVALHSSQ